MERARAIAMVGYLVSWYRTLGGQIDEPRCISVNFQSFRLISAGTQDSGFATTSVS